MSDDCVAVCGTYYVQALQLTSMVVLMGIMVGLMITAILVVNNLRDINIDKRAGTAQLALMFSPLLSLSLILS